MTYQMEPEGRLAYIQTTTIEQHGVVSREVAKTMTSNAYQACRSTISIAAIGAAEPAGGTAETPVGTVCIAIAMSQGICLERLQPTGSQQETIRQICYEIISRLYHLELE